MGLLIKTKETRKEPKVLSERLELSLSTPQILYHRIYRLNIESRLMREEKSYLATRHSRQGFLEKDDNQMKYSETILDLRFHFRNPKRIIKSRIDRLIRSNLKYDIFSLISLRKRMIDSIVFSSIPISHHHIIIS